MLDSVVRLEASILGGYRAQLIFQQKVGTLGV
jgi:hypothetical protein